MYGTCIKDFFCFYLFPVDKYLAYSGCDGHVDPLLIIIRARPDCCYHSCSYMARTRVQGSAHQIES